jgi:triosephosphate isomerase (TIM)
MQSGRQPIVAGNWKMHTTLSEAETLAESLDRPLPQRSGVQTVLCPPYFSLAAVLEVVAGFNVAVGAQNCFFRRRTDTRPPPAASRAPTAGASERR